tara:strand:- start:8154 stop:8390 length:237 start_codon:yes stop_codon:yes gene_type:complete
MNNKIIKNIDKALDEIRPYLKADGGNVEIVELTEDMVLKIKFIGACVVCESNEDTFKNGIESIVQRSFPEVKKIIEIK